MIVLALLRQALLGGALFACLAHLGLGGVLAVSRGWRDGLVFTAYLWAPATLGLFVASAVLALLLARREREAILRATLRVNLYLVLAPVAAATLIVSMRPFWTGNVLHVAALAGLLVGMAVVSRRVAGSLWALANSSVRATLASAVLLALATLPAVLARPEPEPPAAVEVRARPDHPVVLIGFDGASWDVLDPLIEAGRLPNFARLKEEGAWGPLRSEIAANQPFANSASKGMRTPVLWETIATGRTPRDHGVWDFGTTRLPGLRGPVPFRLPQRLLRALPGAHVTPVWSVTGRQKRVWEILADYGLESLVVGWVDSWPAIPDPAVTLVSDRCHWSVAGTTWPAELAERLAPPMFGGLEGEEKEAAESEAYGKLAEEILGIRLDPAWRDAPPDSLLHRESALVHQEAADLARDRYYARVAEQLLRERLANGRALPPLTCLYFPSTDSVQHLFWKYFEPEAFSHVPDASVALYGDAIPRVYEHADSILGRVLDLVGERATVVVVSDHGGGAWTELEGGLGLFQGDAFHEDYSGNHRIHGMLAARGPGIRRGVALPETTLYDVTPLVLHLCGLPAADTMPGEVPEEMFDAGTLRDEPVRRIAGFGARTLPDALTTLDAAGDAEYFDRIAALGYGGGGE